MKPPLSIYKSRSSPNLLMMDDIVTTTRPKTIVETVWRTALNRETRKAYLIMRYLLPKRKPAPDITAVIPEPMRDKTRKALIATARPWKREFIFTRVAPVPWRMGMLALTLRIVYELAIPGPVSDSIPNILVFGNLRP